MDSLHYARKLVDPVPANVQQVFHPFWGFVTKPSPTLGPDMYGGRWKIVSSDFEAVMGRTSVKLKPVVEDPTKSRVRS